MMWRFSNRADPYARAIADRHYNRQKVGAEQFAPPGKCLVLVVDDLEPAARALWISSAPIATYVQHAWAGAWMCTAFRNEGAGLASELILEAVAATVAAWGPPPPLGMVTFVDASKVERKRQPGRCYIKAGFKVVGATQGGLVALQLLPDAFPAPQLGLPPRRGVSSKYAPPRQQDLLNRHLRPGQPAADRIP